MVDCALDREARTIDGSVAITLVNRSEAPLDRVYLWLYPNRFTGETEGLDDVSFYWVNPRRHDPGRMRLGRVTVEQGGRASAALPRAEPHAAAGPDVLWSIPLPAPLQPGERVRVAARYRARLPERYGAFGCVDGQCTMAGGFYPMPAGLDRAGWDLLGPPLVAATDVKVSLSAPASIVLSGEWSGNGAAALRVRAPAVRYATLVVAAEHFESSREVGGARVRFLSPEPPPPADDARRVALAYTLEDQAAHALDTAEAALAMLAEVDRGLRPRALTMVVAPHRLELAVAHEHMVLVSDRFYRIWPAERFRKFHRRQLARAVFAHWLLRRGGGAGDQLDDDEAADLAATWLTDLFTLRRYQRSEYIQNILRPVSFVPSIDLLLYAPQTMFADAYFGDATPHTGGGAAMRDDPRQFMNRRPRGRFYYRKLRDLVGDGPLARALASVVTRGDDLAAAVEAAHRRPLDWFFRQWSLPPSRVNYRLVGHGSTPLGGGQFANQVIVARETAAGEPPPIEPVEVLAVDRDGARHRLRWNGRAQRGVIAYRSGAPIDWAWVDPDRRLEESNIGDQGRHAAFDNRDRHRLRFVYNSFGVLLNVSDLSALLAADFSLSRVHDLENQLRFVAYTSAAVRAGGLLSYRRGFGREVTPDRLIGRAALSLGGARLDDDFFGDMARPGSQASLTASIGGDTEVFMFEPLDKHDLRLAASLTLTRLDAIAGAGAEVFTSGDVGMSTSRTATPAPGHTLAGELAIAAAFGDIESRAQLLAGGGADGVRGFAPGAVFGRGLATIRTEWRHNFVHDLDWNFGNYTFVRGIGGVLFADAGLISPCDRYLPRSGDAVFTSAGYGLQFVYDSFGTLPSLTRIDAAVRLSGRAGPCLGEAPEGGTAVQLYVTFLPPF
jgi:hypothetical protein